MLAHYLSLEFSIIRPKTTGYTKHLARPAYPVRHLLYRVQ